MHPLNRAERQKAFVDFLLLFIVTITVIVTVVFFSIQVPFSHNKQLLKEMSHVESEKELSQAFQREMTDAISLLKKLDTKEVPPEVVNAQVDAKIEKMNSLIKGVPNLENSIYISVIEYISNLKSAKNELRNFSSKENNMAELSLKVQQLTMDIDRKDQKIERLEQALRQTASQ